MKRKVLALTAIRSEYDLFYPVLDALRADFQVGVVACGAHLTALHGRSISNIREDGFRIAATVDNLRGVPDTEEGRVRSIGALISGLAKPLARENPDLLIVLGDREEALAGAIAAGYQNIAVVHIGGGDNTAPAGGDVDEGARHATTKLSHVHLALAKEHERRLLALGEERWRVATIGNPGVDRLLSKKGFTRAELMKRLGAPDRDFVVLIFHALSSTAARAGRDMDACLDACLDTGLEVFVSAPNSDPGSRDILAAVKRRSKEPRLHAYKNLPRAEFVSLLRHARALAGNSSLAFHEAPSLGLPCVNAGERQTGRLNAGNVEFCAPDAAAILKALSRAAFDEGYRARVRRLRSPYGDGRAAQRAVAFLKKLPGRDRLLAKRITY